MGIGLPSLRYGFNSRLRPVLRRRRRIGASSLTVELAAAPAQGESRVETNDSRFRCRLVLALWRYPCVMCHGKNGDGKGDVAADLKLKMRDESDPATLKDLSDGALFYILTKGKDQMPPEAGRGKDTRGSSDIGELCAVVLEEGDASEEQTRGREGAELDIA